MSHNLPTSIRPFMGPQPSDCPLKREKRTLVINFAAGPGAGKSTNAAHLFSELKRLGVNAEYVGEYAKDVTWREAQSILKDQVYVFAKQRNRLFVLNGQVDVIVTDSPLFLGLVYGSVSPDFERFVLQEYFRFDNHTFFILREKAYNPKGRNQSEEEAKEKDREICDLMLYHRIPFQYIPDTREAMQELAQDIVKKLGVGG